ncbi:MAG: NADH-quinone oxidoreductase subunit L [Verrucomicrobia bacterium GWF2_62_7]|nr:MAG: NADH-quinone oxidoreductase subunit L [Verrucomicrobia bacterium GWF2_62_7]
MEDVSGLLWRVLAGPLSAAVVIWLLCHKSKFYADFGPVMERQAAAFIAIGFLAGSTMFAYWAFGAVRDGAVMENRSLYEFLSAGDLMVEINWSLDRLSGLMMMVVCGVSLCIMVYSIGYMEEDPGVNRFFAKLSFFVFSMLGVVLSGNFLMMFIFWELVGVSSYLLIGYWYERPSAADAGKKAFIVNRLGDFGFLLGILILWGITGEVDFVRVKNNLAAHPIDPNLLAVATVLIFCGAVGKSAQFPLHVWLPDAMEGPTPVSALIHAATMVAAGVYMLCRVSFLVFGSPVAMEIIAWTGGITALMAALIATQQNDIKRILAYSTLSQLGYMVMAVGLSNPAGSGYMPAMFHLSTHAFFKALLFLSAGSVIIALHHSEQDIWNMGGLLKKLPVTGACFAVGTLALCGFPFMSGFYSKEAILGLAHERNPQLYLLATVTAGLTAFYMFRCFFVAFLGKTRGEHAEKAKESHWVVLAPLVVLAVASICGGWFGIPEWLVENKAISAEHAPKSVMLAALAAFAIGAGAAAFLYARGATTDALNKLPVLSWVLRNKFFFDEIYMVLVKVGQGTLAWLCGFVDRWIIAGLAVRGLAATTRGAGQVLRLFQTGNVQTYALWFAAGATIILYCLVR